MNCPSCGVETTADSQFCPKCGLNFKSKGDVKPSSPLTPPSHSGSAKGEMEPESQVWSGGYSAKAMIGSWLLAIILSIGLAAAGFYQGTQEVWMGAAVAILLIWMVLGLLFLYRRLSLQYTLTNQKFIHSAGILRRTTDRIELIDVDDVSFEQGIVQRILGVGSIKISSSDKSHPQMVLIGIDNVQAIAAKLDDLRRRERRKHAVHIESV